MMIIRQAALCELNTQYQHLEDFLTKAFAHIFEQMTKETNNLTYANHSKLDRRIEGL